MAKGIRLLDKKAIFVYTLYRKHFMQVRAFESYNSINTQNSPNILVLFKSLQFLSLLTLHNFNINSESHLVFKIGVSEDDCRELQLTGKKRKLSMQVHSLKTT